MMVQTIGRQAASFVGVGTVGFAVDGGILTLLNSLYDIELLPARMTSFSVAVTVTWGLNRARTFADRKDQRMVREWGRYAAVNSIGALLNLGIFFWLLRRFSIFEDTPLIPLAIAASVALVFNFVASRQVAFRYPQT
jgi:putative flippase GtrA